MGTCREFLFAVLFAIILADVHEGTIHAGCAVSSFVKDAERRMLVVAILVF